MNYRELAAQAAQRHGIPVDLFMALVQAESSWNPGAVSPKGAIGLGQLMPGTAAELGVDPRDPAQNLEGAARYLAQQYRTFGDWRKAAAAYNAGPGNVRKYGGIPPFKETQNYVAKLFGQQTGTPFVPPQPQTPMQAPMPPQNVMAQFQFRPVQLDPRNFMSQAPAMNFRRIGNQA